MKYWLFGNSKQNSYSEIQSGQKPDSEAGEEPKKPDEDFW
jgi:hypothetical protein